MKLKLCLYFKAAAVVPLAQKPPTIAGPSLQRAFKASFPTPRLVLFVLAELLYTKGMDRVSFSQLYKKKKNGYLPMLLWRNCTFRLPHCNGSDSK